VAVPGVAERARPKFEHAVAWVVAEREDAEVAGFVLATGPGSGGPSDPPGAVVIGLVAVRPSDQGAGLATRMLAAVESRLVAAGFDDAVLHVLSDNAAAVRLYESAGWTPFGAAFEHPLLKRPTQTYRRSLALAAGR
jgi:ribosomal protein S18 acetylase RimI-like enzyme